METAMDVHTDLAGRPHLVGHMWAVLGRGQMRSTFQYDPSWLANPMGFALDPSLPLTRSTFHTPVGRELFGAISDSAPDKWGRVLLERYETMTAQRQGRTQRTLQAVDYLLGVNDLARQGALRFTLAGESVFLADPRLNPLPHIEQLPKLLASASRVGTDKEVLDDVRILLAPGSSVGGARPKACVYDKAGTLCLVKFPSPKDKWDVVLWEYLALRIAQDAGLTVPRFQLATFAGKHVLILERFDRKGSTRIPYISAMSMLELTYGESGSYEYLAEAIQMAGSDPQKDQRELFGRMVLNILINNTDDHMRNHGFLGQGAGWRLSPLFDLEPTPPVEKARFLNTAIHGSSTTASIDLALAASKNFNIPLSEAKAIAIKVARAVKNWSSHTRGIKICQNDKTLFASTIDHPDLANLLRMAPI